MKASAEKSSITTSTSATQAAQRPFFAPSVQAKLTVGKRDDVLEREADAVADRVVNRRGVGQAGGGQAPLQGASPRQENAGRWEEKEKWRRQSWPGSTAPDLQRQEEPDREPEVKEEAETPAGTEEQVQAKSLTGEGWGVGEAADAGSGGAADYPLPLTHSRKGRGDEEPLQAKLMPGAKDEEPGIAADKYYSDIDDITDLTKAEKGKLKKDIKVQITKGLRQLENQPMKTLKDY